MPTENPSVTIPKSPDPNPLVLIVVISLIVGFLGGLGGATLVMRSPQLRSGPLSPTATYKEDSAIINVVKKDSPAVVSVVISKDVSKLEPNPLLSPFFNFGFPAPQPQAQPSAPNIQQVGAGSGFFVTADGLILTNKHVVADQQASYTVVTTDGKSYDAKVMARDPVNDLAILKIDIKNAPALALVDSTQVEIGQRVVAIGNSLGQYQNTVTAGIVSGIGRSITAGGNDGSEQLEGVIQTDAAINPGNSGGPLLNLAGQVIGINTAIDQQGQLVGFAIPASDASRALASFQKNGRISRPFLGVRYVIVTPAMASGQKLSRNYGALILRGQTAADLAVIPGSPADKAGLVENDIILEVNGQRIDETHTLSGQIKKFQVGDSVTLKIYDKGTEKTVTATLEEAK